MITSDWLDASIVLHIFKWSSHEAVIINPITTEVNATKWSTKYLVVQLEAGDELLSVCGSSCVSEWTHGHTSPTEAQVDALPGLCFHTQTIISPEMVYRSCYHLSSSHSRRGKKKQKKKLCFCLPRVAKIHKDSLQFGWLLCGSLMWQRLPVVLVVTYLERRRCGDRRARNVNFPEPENDSTVWVRERNSTAHGHVISPALRCCTPVFEKWHLSCSFVVVVFFFAGMKLNQPWVSSQWNKSFFLSLSPRYSQALR